MRKRPRILTVLLVAVVALGGLSACSSGSGAVTDVSPSAAADVLAKPGVTVIDVRTPAEFASGHLKGAVNIDVEAAGFDDAIGKLPKDGTYLVYCRSGNRSAVATSKMADLGFSTVDNLQGGITQWQSNGGAVVTT